jgi:hypothetical protein
MPIILPAHQFDSPEGAAVFWHSSSHLLGLAIEREYSPAPAERPASTVKVQLCDGPALSAEKGGLGTPPQLSICVFWASLTSPDHTRTIVTPRRFLLRVLPSTGRGRNGSVYGRLCRAGEEGGGLCQGKETV